MEFKHFCREMYIDNVDERLECGEPILQYDEYVEKYQHYLELSYDKKYNEVAGE